MPARRLAKKALAPLERFLSVEASSGIVLLFVSLVALAWANSPWSATYEALWHAPLGLRVGAWVFMRDVHFLINDGLMTLFFFVVGLEIRREMHKGELRDLRRAALPIVAALGGMAMPALLFFALNVHRASLVGWGVPMATDIAFAVGVLALLGTRIPPAMRILLLTLAVIDDVGAIAVIAAFYASGFSAWGLLVSGIGVLAVITLQKIGVRSPWAYVVPGVVVWIGTYQTGVHPTIAGVAVGLLTPVHAWLGIGRFFDRAKSTVARIENTDLDDEKAVLPELDKLNAARREAVSPVETLQHALHGWVAFGIMPLFAFANAGVQLGGTDFSGDSLRVFFGVVIGLVLGKPIGILLVSWSAVRLRVARLPTGLRWRHVAIVGAVAGIGFTMALFVAQLAFPAGAHLEGAKLAILSSSALAAILALTSGRLMLGHVHHEGAARSDAEAEGSTER